MKDKVCQHCGKPLTGRQRKWCGRLCEDANYYKKVALRDARASKQKPNGKQCIGCKAPLKGVQKKWCSNRCATVQWVKSHPEALAAYRTQKGNCPECGISLYEQGFRWHNGSLYCVPCKALLINRPISNTPAA